MTIAAPQAPSRAPDSACIDCIGHSPATGRARLAVPRHVAFWLMAFVFAAAMLGTTLPTPLYVIYQARWHSSAAIVTLIFAVYAAGATAVALPPLAAVHPRVAQGWHEVAADPQPCLSLGLASSALLDRSLPALVASTELVILAGAFLTHSTRGGSAMGCAGA